MNNYEFYHVLLGHVWLYIGLLLASGLIHYIFLKRLIITILDPYVLPAVFSTFCGASIWMLYLTGKVNLYAIASYSLTQLAFFIGLYCFNSIGPRVKRGIYTFTTGSFTLGDKEERRARASVIFYLSMIILVMGQGAIYYLKGIPLLMDSRLETFAQGKGEGILGRIVDVSLISALFSFFTLIRFDALRWSEVTKYFCLAIIFIIFFLSGSKSGFLTVVLVIWAHLVFSIIKGQSVSKYLTVLNYFKKHFKKIVLGSVTLVILIIAIQTRKLGPDSPGTLLLVALRFVHSADTFWYAYPNNVYMGIDNSAPFHALFSDFLGILRIYDWSELPPAIGLYLKQLHHPSDLVEGPNARHNIFGLIFFGFFGSIALSFFLGIILSFIRNRLVFMVKSDVVSGIIFCYLVIKGASIDADPMLFFSYVDNFIFVLLPLLAVMSVISNLLVVRKTSQIDPA